MRFLTRSLAYLLVRGPLSAQYTIHRSKITTKRPTLKTKHTYINTKERHPTLLSWSFTFEFIITASYAFIICTRKWYR